MKLIRTAAVTKVDIILVNKNFLTRWNLKNKGMIPYVLLSQLVMYFMYYLRLFATISGLGTGTQGDIGSNTSSVC